METSIIEEFIKLVETCSFQETALQMNISQSSLSKHIHKLEEELDVVLFDRSTRSVGLTDYGSTFYPYAKQILEASHEAKMVLDELSAKDKKRLRVSYRPIMGQYGLIETLAEYAEKNPAHHLYPIESYQPMELLKAKKCTFAFVTEEEIGSSSFNQIIFKTDYLAAVLPADHALAKEKTVTLEQLSDESFILHSNHRGYPHSETKKFLDLCEEHHFQPNVVAESEFTNSVLRFVKSKRGIAVLNRLRIPTDVDDIAIVNLAPSVHTHIYLLYPRHLTSTSEKEFLHYMIEKINS